MAAYLGKDGSVTVSSSSSTVPTTALSLIDSWTLNTNIDLVDVTAFGSSFRARAQALRDWSVELSGTLDRSDSDQAMMLDQFEDATMAFVHFRLNTVTSTSGLGLKYWGGVAPLANASIVSSVGDKVALALSLQGSGELKYGTTNT